MLGADVTIRGNLEASADLHFDGTIEGDITCASLAQGEGSHITGAILADKARLSGVVKGTVTVRDLVVLHTARIEGDLRYEKLTIEPGAAVDGRLTPGSGAAAPNTAAASAVEQGPDEDDEPRLTLAG